MGKSTWGEVTGDPSSAIPGQQPAHRSPPHAIVYLPALPRSAWEGFAGLLWRQPREGSSSLHKAFLCILFISQSRSNRERDPDKRQVPGDGCQEIQVKQLQTACGSAHLPPGTGPQCSDLGLCLSSLTFYLLEAPSAHRLVLGYFHFTAGPGRRARRRQTLRLEQTQTREFFSFFFLLKQKNESLLSPNWKSRSVPPLLPFLCLYPSKGVSSALPWELHAPTAQ